MICHSTMSLALIAVGCRGPLMIPMVVRVEPETQATIDDAWNNMLTPPDRLDRTLLLDVIVAHQMHSLGVDRLRMTSEKYLAEGLVVMDISFNREEPALDTFTVSLIDHAGEELRRERFVRAEIEGSLRALWGVEFTVAAFGQPTVVASENDQRLESERHSLLEQIQAATQPAVEP